TGFSRWRRIQRPAPAGKSVARHQPAPTSQPDSPQQPASAGKDDDPEDRAQNDGDGEVPHPSRLTEKRFTDRNDAPSRKRPCVQRAMESRMLTFECILAVFLAVCFVLAFRQ